MKILTRPDLGRSLEPWFQNIPIQNSPICNGCAEFIPSERTPSVGICLLHAVHVLAQDKACSHYYQDEYQDETVEPVASDDEF